MYRLFQRNFIFWLATTIHKHCQEQGCWFVLCIAPFLRVQRYLPLLKKRKKCSDKKCLKIKFCNQQSARISKLQASRKNLWYCTYFNLLSKVDESQYNITYPLVLFFFTCCSTTRHLWPEFECLPVLSLYAPYKRITYIQVFLYL